MKMINPVLAVLVSFASLVPTATSVRSHGADWEVRIVGQRLGGYDVTVRTAPKQPRTGRLHIEVQLIAPENLAYIDRATVTATARFRGGETVQAGPVLSRYRESWHEMDLSLKKSGSWDVHLAIDGPRGREEIFFRVDVSPEGSGIAPGPLGALTLSPAFAAAPAAEGYYVKIIAPADGARLERMKPTTLVYEVGPGPRSGHVHVHLYVDGKEVDILRQLKGSYTLESLSPGQRSLCVKVVNRAHVPIGVEQCVKVTVE